jgi:hypothetical protein
MSRHSAGAHSVTSLMYVKLLVQLHKIFELQAMNYAACLDLTNQLQEFISDKDIKYSS